MPGAIETYALALDSGKKPCAVRTSNAGQVLFTGIADPTRAALVARGLLRPEELFFGLRKCPRWRARRSVPRSDEVSQRLRPAARKRANCAEFRPLSG